jgi:hypothetical protein
VGLLLQVIAAAKGGITQIHVGRLNVRRAL